ncbi:MAG TPA: plastocyanin/azurin family copper-binding protein [Symbiobacteriaceae bacterium]|nr:plastocyanin/azurin family copper-binding protein [Symbiobacteriaceae bacterium]
MTYKLIMLALVAVLTLGCSPAPAQDSGEVFSGTMEVNMKNLKYVPGAFTVKKGTVVTFVNQDGMAHNVVQIAQKEMSKGQPGFISDVIGPGKSWSVTMDQPGTYPILCTESAHYTSGMVGTITVVE